MHYLHNNLTLCYIGKSNIWHHILKYLKMAWTFRDPARTQHDWGSLSQVAEVCVLCLLLILWLDIT